MTPKRTDWSGRSVFLGRHSHTIDDKGRIALPARFREQLAGGIVVTRGFDRCLLAYPVEAWMPLAERVSALSIGDPDVRVLRRMLFAHATDLNLDKQGRVLIPADLRSHAGLEREAIVVGMHTFIEIWSPTEWEQADELAEREGPAIAEKLAALV